MASVTASVAADRSSLSAVCKAAASQNSCFGFCWGSGPQTSAFRSLETGVERRGPASPPSGWTAPHSPGRDALGEPVSASSRQSSLETPRFRS